VETSTPFLISGGNRSQIRGSGILISGGRRAFGEGERVQDDFASENRLGQKCGATRALCLIARRLIAPVGNEHDDPAVC
jgi:hypothetical protein